MKSEATRTMNRIYPGAGFPALLLGILLLSGPAAQAQTTPVMVKVPQSVLDEAGQPLSATEGDLVQFLLVNGQIYPPGSDGQPNAANPVVFSSRIGNGLVPSPEKAGQLNAAITPYPSGPVFARVFNAPTLAQASFYADAQAFTPNGRAVYYPSLAATTNALDPADDDGDGLNNSWEKSLGSDRLAVDSDHDGMSDGDEFRAGTGLADAESFLAMVQVAPQAGGNLQAQWEAVPGKAYQLQFTDQSLSDPSMAFSNVNGVVTATGVTGVTVITNGASFPVGFFRVVLVENAP